MIEPVTLPGLNESVCCDKTGIETFPATIPRKGIGGATTISTPRWVATDSAAFARFRALSPETSR
jgi:hypothetical protein